MRLVVDACSWINLVNGNGALAVVLRLPGFEWHVGPLVRDECGDLAEVEAAVGEGNVNALDDSLIGVNAFTALRTKHRLGPGETECIAFAMALGFGVCTDDGRAREAAATELGKDRLIGSIGLLKRSVSAGLITAAGALDMYEHMVARGAYLPVCAVTDFA
jgi:predicted nucleic acid-binding protein